MSDPTCPDCGRQYADSYPLWQCSDSTCGLSPTWNPHGEQHDDCINECLYATKGSLRAQLTEAQRENEAWRALAAESSGRAMSLDFSRHGEGDWSLEIADYPQVIGSVAKGDYAHGATPQAAAMALATKLNLLTPKA